MHRANGNRSIAEFYAGMESNLRRKFAASLGLCSAPIYATVEQPSNVINSNSQTAAGEMAEWFKAHAWKACVL